MTASKGGEEQHMASLPVDSVLVGANDATEARPIAPPRRTRRPRRNGWLHLLFGSGPCWYRLLRFGQRHRD